MKLRKVHEWYWFPRLFIHRFPYGLWGSWSRYELQWFNYLLVFTY